MPALDVTSTPGLQSALLDLGFDLPVAEIVAREVGRGTRAVLRRFQQASDLLSTGLADTATLDALAAAVSDQARTLRVAGRVVRADGSPAVEVVVIAFDRDLRREQPLGETPTDGDGYFLISYTPRQFARAEKNSADLLVRVYEGEQVVFDPGVPGIRFNAPDLAVFQVTLSTSGDAEGDTEYDRIHDTVTRLLDDVSLDGLRQDDEMGDIAFIAAESGLDAWKLQHFAVAHKLAAAHQLPATLFYALFADDILCRVGGAAGLRFSIDLQTPLEPLFYDVVLLSPWDVTAAVDQAVADRVVGRELWDQMDHVAGYLSEQRAAARAYLRERRAAVLLATVDQFLADGGHEHVMELLSTDAFGDLPGLVAKLQAGGGLLRRDVSPSAVQAGLAFAEVLGFDGPLVERLRGTRGFTRTEDVAALAELSHADWVELLAEHAPGPLVDQHAHALAERLQARFPTRAFAAHLGRDREAFGSHSDTILEFLGAHPDVDLADTNIEALLRRRAIPGMRERGPSGTALDALKAVQRIFKLAPTFRQARALLDAGLHSAAAVHALGQSRFAAMAARTGAFTVAEAATAYARATDMHVASTLLAGELQALPAAMRVRALSGGTQTTTALARAQEEHPNLRTLFGTGDICACDTCQSVHSASAYLVDTLQFLKQRLVYDATAAVPAAQKIARDVLFERRPDLGDTDLSCANTNTSMPYLDLVCELLEDAVAPDPGTFHTGPLSTETNASGQQVGPIAPALLATAVAAGLPFTPAALVFPPDLHGAQVLRDTSAVAKLTPEAGGWRMRLMRQTYGTEAELAAAPRYVNTDAYTTLADTTLAFGLPFDLPHQETRAYFAQVEIERAQLMRLLQSGATPAEHVIAAEAWGLSDIERHIITTPDPDKQHIIWRTPGAPAAATMSNAAALLARTGLEHQDLRTLLGLRWLNPASGMHLQYLKPGCDPHDQEIANLDDAALDRMHRFIRLWRATGWSAPDLNRVICGPGLGAGTLNAACLITTRKLADVAARLNLTIAEATDLFDKLPWEGNTSRYAAVYLNTAASGTPPDILRPDNVQANEALPAETAVTLASQRLPLALALGVSPDDIDSFLTLLPDQAPVGAAGLSTLHALHVFTRAAALNAPDLKLLQDLTGIDPLSGPHEALLFLDALEAQRSSGVAPADLAYLLRHEATDLPARELTEETVTALLTALATGYRAAYAQLSRLPGRTASQISGVLAVVDGLWSHPEITPQNLITQTLGDFVDTAPITDAVVAAPNDGERAAMMTLIGSSVADYLYKHAKEALLVPAVVEATGSDDAMVRAALTGRLRQPAAADAPTLTDLLTDDTLRTAPAITPAATDLQYRAVRSLHTTLTLARVLRLTPPQLDWLLAHADTLDWLSPDALPYAAGLASAPYDEWEALRDGSALLTRLTPVADPASPSKRWTPQAFFDHVRDPAATAKTVTAYLGRLAGADPQTLLDLDAHMGLSTTGLGSYRSPAVLDRLLATAALLRRLGLTTADALALVKATLTSEDAKTMRRALKTRYAEADWFGVLRGIYDRLRGPKRDALVAYLLAVNPSLTSVDDLYESLLIDVQMSSCMATTRIVQAHATVQLFVQRCLMGIERRCVADVRADTGWAQWQWMANYRVWEANVKVFLWPENYLFTDGRDDRTELFEALDNTLKQSPLTDIAVEDAAAAYLDGLDEIALLDVMACHYESGADTLHVFGRSRGGDPPIFHYRRFERERTWTPWERVPLDITSEHLLAFERNERLMVAWPTFTIEANTEVEMEITPTPSTTPPPQKRMKIQLSVSERVNGRWRPKKISKNPVMFPADGTYTEYLPDPQHLNFFVADLAAAGQSVTCVHISGYVLGAFALTGCKGFPEPSGSSGGTLTLSPLFENTTLRAERFTENPETAGSELAIATLVTGGWERILERTPNPGSFTVTYPMQMNRNDMLIFVLRSLLTGKPVGIPATLGEHRRGTPVPLGTFMPYFYGDHDRSYVVVPGLYPRTDEDDASNLAGPRTYSDLDHFVTDALALLAKYLKLYQEDPAHDLTALIKRLTKDPEYLRLVAVADHARRGRYGVQFRAFYHPLACLLRRTLSRAGLPGLMRRDLQFTDTGFDFWDSYQPTPSVVPAYPREDIDFTREGAYSVYNWELFFHLPRRIAKLLNQDRRFSEAREWLHYIFNPVGVLDPAVPGAPAPTAPHKYWITKPFFQVQPADYLAQRIESITTNVALDPSGTGLGALGFAIEQWRAKPFSPYVIARSRPVALQIATVTDYVQNLIDWADSLFQSFTREAITQATQLYIMADQLLGPKPKVVPPNVTAPVETYNQLEGNVDLLANALVDLENLIPQQGLPPAPSSTPPALSASTLYFCLPPNEELLRMWDVIADRLFKIRNCQNFDGVQASLALFSPPIDPGALVRATAKGVDISSYLAGLAAPLPHYRFTTYSQKATELVEHVSTLGIELLSVLEKRDAEALARLRATQEKTVLDAVRVVKQTAIAEADAILQGLHRSRDVTKTKRNNYASRKFSNTWEDSATALSGASLLGEVSVASGHSLSGVLRLVPNFLLGVAGIGGSPAANAGTGGDKTAEVSRSTADTFASMMRSADKGAGMAATQGLLHRRQEDWDYQVQVADKELTQIDQQIAAAELRAQMLRDDLAAHDRQTDAATANREYLEGKFTATELYDWTLTQISSVYFSSYQLALDAAKKAERCFEYELAVDADFITGGYWDGLRKGLTSATALSHAIKRMEVAYLDQNRREYELTKHISLVQLDPAALIELRATGSCHIDIPETLFDLDYPGHYRRRIKSVSVSIPCVVGPYTTVSATLSLISNRYRAKTALRTAATDYDQYHEQLNGDDRFVYNLGAISSIATSSGVSDSGTFDLNLNDDRYLPFEGAGAISHWLLELPKEYRQFDYDSISDVVLHLHYTARDGGSTLKKTVVGALQQLTSELVSSNGAEGLFHGYRFAEEFPTEWFQLKQSGHTRITLTAAHLPFVVRGHKPQIENFIWCATAPGAATVSLTVNGADLTLAKDPKTKVCVTTTAAVQLGSPVDIGIQPGTDLNDLTLLVRYTLKAT
jgi:hypothetical protein